ncbi:hypothetical protein TIFTF001_044538 [Ficus carica]|uniref:Cytochrome P450 n=1 Tax=Ficus carica TaxID=3494 RepID=A0AA88CV62_FICCA|nr:hypothetical protein TIFTF001_044538 [Ficus carica]
MPVSSKLLYCTFFMELKLPSYTVLFTSFVFLFMVLNIFVKRAKPAGSYSKLPPGPWKLPFVENMHQLFGSLPHHALRDLAKKHGPFMYLKIGQVPTIVVSSPEFAKEVMRFHDTIFAFRPRLLFSQVIAYDCTDVAFAPYGEYWRQVRKICVLELLSAARVQSFRHIREEEVFNLVEWVASNVGSVIDLTKRIESTTFSIISRAAFGGKSKDHEDFISIVAEASEALGSFCLVDSFPSLGSFLEVITRERAKLENMRQRAARIFEIIIKKHEAEIQKGKTRKTEDLVDVLLKLHNNDHLEFSLTSDNVKAIIWDIFAAGGETATTTIDWAMAEIIKNPRVMKRVQDEVREIFGRQGSLDEACISEMTYFKCVVKETLRLHPAAPLLLPRECGEKCEINGFVIPAKTRIIVNAWAIARDSRYWIEPESFIPERFLDSSVDYKGINFEYIPFGAGRRICPGISFGMSNVELQLALLLYHFDWILPNGMKPEDLDMTDSFGTAVRRKYGLLLIPISYNPTPVAKSE